MQISKNKVVTMEYTLTGDGGEVLDSSDGGEPLAYLHGVGGIIPGLEEALEGKAAGDALNVTIAPDKGYGNRDEQLINSVPKSEFAGIDDLQEGMPLQAQTEQGVQVFWVTKIEADSVTVDGNHPLAGMTLNFDVKVVEVRDATQEELTHGHVHGPGGHEH